MIVFIKSLLLAGMLFFGIGAYLGQKATNPDDYGSVFLVIVGVVLMLLAGAISAVWWII